MPSNDCDHRRRVTSRRLVVGALLATLLLSGCSKQSILSPRSPQTHDISVLWWAMLATATIVFLGAVALLAMAWFRRATPGLPFIGEREDVSQGLVLLFGIGIPLVVLCALFAVANIYVIGKTAPPDPRSTTMTIEVIGHQWWWEVRYPATARGYAEAITANEIHIPTGTRVNVTTTSADVIHSFWVPRLARKIDMIPGKQNRILLEASRAGTYRGQCAEFCGFQHANMGMLVVAQPPGQFQSWLAHMAAPATAPTSASTRAGQQAFMTSQCASCHQIRGTAARATVGPDLTHLQTRSTLAAGEIPNNPSELAAWISNPQGIKPGARMPNLGLSQTQVSALVSYLETLR